MRLTLFLGHVEGTETERLSTGEEICLKGKLSRLEVFKKEPVKPRKKSPEKGDLRSTALKILRKILIVLKEVQTQKPLFLPKSASEEKNRDLQGV